MWAGLGYYRRVRMFHQAAQQVQEDLGGKIPRNPEELRKLPGIGRYTAGAIASIAFGEKAPVLDGNVIRILTRIFALPRALTSPPHWQSYGLSPPRSSQTKTPVTLIKRSWNSAQRSASHPILHVPVVP
jgi:endonuclease III